MAQAEALEHSTILVVHVDEPEVTPRRTEVLRGSKIAETTSAPITETRGNTDHD
jgi:hypothetical protein